MNTLKHITILLLAASLLACKKDEVQPQLATNTWAFKADHLATKTTFEAKTFQFNMQGQGVFGAESKTRYSGGVGADGSTIKLFFKSFPPTTGTYKVTNINSVAQHNDEVAVYVLLGADPEISGSQTVWNSEGDGSQTIDYKFENGKVTTAFSGIKLYHSQGAQAPITATVDANFNH